MLPPYPPDRGFPPELARVIAPILLPLVQLLAVWIGNPAPIVEWEASPLPNGDGHRVTLEMVTLEPTDLCQLMVFVPAEANVAIPGVSASNATKHWNVNNVWHWMWDTQQPSMILNVDVFHRNAQSLDLTWDVVHKGQRRQINLGQIELGPPTLSTPHVTPSDFTKAPSASRSLTLESDHSALVTLALNGFEPGGFLKWTEFVPEGCTCSVLNDGESALRSTENSEIFLWFQAPDSSRIEVELRLQCQQEIHDKMPFDGTLEWAFGSDGDLVHIAGVEWEGASSAQLESMKLKQSPEDQGVTPYSTVPPDGGHGSQVGSILTYSVQLLANHRDVSPAEFARAVAFDDAFHIERHEGWHKYLTDAVESYGKARSVRSNVWANTNATDAFVTAHLDGQRITVQEALLMSNETWMP